MIVFYTVMMTLNLTCAFLILMSGIRQQKLYLLSLAVLNLIGFFFHYYSWQLHNAESLNQAIWFSQLQTVTIILSLPVIVYTFGKWSKFSYTVHCAIVLLIIALLFILLSYISGIHLRYTDILKLVHYQTLFGSKLVILDGKLSDLFIAYNLLYVVNSGLLILFAARLYQQSKRLLSASLITFLCLQSLANFASYKLDALEWPLFYLGGAPLTLFSVLCTALISLLYKAKTLQLIEHREQQAKLDKAITKLARGISPGNSQHYYLRLAKMIYEFSEADFIVLARINDQQVETFIVLQKGLLREGYCYPVADTPASLLLSQDLCLLSSDAESQFSCDEILTREHIQTYLGVPILEQSRIAVGFISIYFKEKTMIHPSLVNALKIFASRVAVESKRRELERTLTRMAYYDQQSGLPNRAKLLDVIESEFKRCIEQDEQSLFMMIDIDNFSEVNRLYGFSVGDQVITTLGSRLKSYSNHRYFLARNSGDEFIVIDSRVNSEPQQLLSQHWLAIKELITGPCIIGERKINIECSMGGVLFPEQARNQFDVMSFAEHSVLRAKENGKGQCMLFDPAILAKLDEKKEIELALTEAISNQQLSLVYQAKVTSNGEVIGAEALLRWLHPSKGNIPPNEFIAIAEECGLIHSIGRWVTYETCRQIQEWAEHGDPLFKVSINVAAVQFEDPSFISFVFEMLEKHQVSAEFLEIELTETGLLLDIERAVESIHQLREYGISIAIDDFGTGFSSLSYLHDLPLDVLKIDKSFVDHLGEEKSDVLIKSIIAISENMNFKTVAEGTENQQQVDALVEMGCNYFQGYLFCKPLPANDYIDFCRQQGAQLKT